MSASRDELEAPCVLVQVLAGDATEAGATAHAGVWSSAAADGAELARGGLLRGAHGCCKVGWRARGQLFKASLQRRSPEDTKQVTMDPKFGVGLHQPRSGLPR